MSIKSIMVNSENHYIKQPAEKGYINMSKSKKLTSAELKKCLKEISRNRLESIICTLYKESDQAMIYFNSLFKSEETQEENLRSYEKKLRKCFAFSNPNSPDIQTGEKIIKEAKKFTNMRVTLYIILCFVELGTEFTNDYGDIDEYFYESLVNAFDDFVALLNAENNDAMYKEFKGRINQVIQNSLHIGWGYGDTLDTLKNDIVWIAPAMAAAEAEVKKQSL